MKKIGIIGCGWLGMPLAKVLSQKHYEVIGSTTTAAKLKNIASLGVIPVLLKLNPMPEGANFQKLFKCESLIINIPPSSRTNTPEFYREQIKYLKYMINNSPEVRRVIFISSTSYYPNTDQVVDEQTHYDLDNGSNKSVVWAEQEISEVKKELIVLRCGGLLGYDRIPGKYFAGKTTPGKNNPVNYIHRDDVITEVTKLLATEHWPPVRNMVHPSHYLKAEVVGAMSKKHGFTPPQWIAPDRSPTKIVKSLYPFDNLIDPLEF